MMRYQDQIKTEGATVKAWAVPQPFEIKASRVKSGATVLPPDSGTPPYSPGPPDPQCVEGVEDYVTNRLRCRWTISAAADSVVEIMLHEPLNLLGWLNGAAKYCCGVEFFVDGVSLGEAYAACDATKVIRLLPGPHRLEVKAKHGIDFCYTVWGFEPEAALLLPPQYFLTIGAIWKDGSEGLEEWVNHHHGIGVEHFYLVDTGTQRGLASTIRALDLEDVVTVESMKVTGAAGAEAEAYEYLTNKYVATCQWMALIDTNEFLVPKLGTSLKKYLMAFEDFGAVKTCRRMFVSENGYYRDDRLKFIVQPRFVTQILSAHEVEMMPGRQAVSQHFDDYITDLHLQINHYHRAVAGASCPLAETNTPQLTTKKPPEAKPLVNPGMVTDPQPVQAGQQNAPATAERELYQDRSMEDLRRRQATVPFPPDDVPVYGYIHIGAVGHWRAILNSQLKRCQQSGLWDRTAEIRVGIVGSTPEILAELADLPKKIRIVSSDPDLRKFEFPTLTALQASCEEDELSYIWYIHSKGAVNRHPVQHGWRARMEEFIMFHHELAIDRMDAGHVAAAGFGMRNPWCHIAGNFWWIRSDYARLLPKFKDLNWGDRYLAERWIGAAGLGGFYIHDFGDILHEDWEILSSHTGGGTVTTVQYHGWEHIPEGRNRFPVLASAELPLFDYMISAHGPSHVEINLEKEAEIMGFVCGTGSSTGWVLRFYVNEISIGKVDACNVPTMARVLPPGRHDLEIHLTKGEATVAHSVWGIRFLEGVETKQ